ncbi:fibronectin type III domain-containing protein [Lactococcus lactis]|uniref:fibronectin type III domain-containing protein n=1 Tax=Lactococcus lactis TaxID=1358 RepID=UPI00288D9E2E|nr:fibronectin type III domain-containing protein [Lactococcus lactis]MDT2938603.1 fibronectin type III domain-containing protein [Lactococcus lactis]
MLDDSSNRLIWIAVGLALIFGIFETYNGTIPKILESVTSTTQASIPVEHTAYAYSADGTDRFSTVYPNLNLMNGSSAKTKDGFFKNFDKVENDYGEVTIKGTNTWVNRDISDGFSIKPRDYNPNDKYTMSMDVMFTSWNLPAGTTLTEFWLGQRYNKSSDGKITSWKQISFIDLPRDPSKMLNQWIRITQTSTIPSYADPSVNTEAIFMTKFTGPSEGSYTIRVRRPKQEFGSVSTPWMPSASEVQDSDYPTYVGTYTDHNQSASNDPTKYTWKKRG